jgi:hypothetical protein
MTIPRFPGGCTSQETAHAGQLAASRRDRAHRKHSRHIQPPRRALAAGDHEAIRPRTLGERRRHRDPLLLIAVLGLARPGSQPDSGLAACTFLSSTRHVAASDFGHAAPLRRPGQHPGGLQTAALAALHLRPAHLHAETPDSCRAAAHLPSQ